MKICSGRNISDWNMHCLESRQRIRTLDVDVNKKWFEPDAIKQTGCPVWSEKDVCEDELYFLHSCEAYTTVSHN